MHAFFKAAVLILGPLACTVAAAADAADFRCTIEKRVGAPSEPPALRAAYEKAHVGKQFTVERKSGIMSGALKNAFLADPEIIDDGASGKAYRVLTVIRSGESDIYGPGVYALVIEASTSPAGGPFVFLEDRVVYSGRCAQQ